MGRQAGWFRVREAGCAAGFAWGLAVLLSCGGNGSGGDSGPAGFDLVLNPDYGSGADGTDPGADGTDPGPNVIVGTDLGPQDPGPEDPGGNVITSDTGGPDGVELLCSPRTKYVYVVTDTDEFLKFDPKTGAFTPLGTLDCPGALYENPFSMAIDREANAWVLYSDGSLFKVSTLDASCVAVAFVSDQYGFDRFGMGFSSDVEGGSDETLFISELVDTGEPARLGRIAFPSLTVSPIGTAMAESSAELTGNGKGELWGFFPQAATPLVGRIDKTTAGILDQYPIPATVFSGSVTAWAFAFWGGYFYVFVATGGDNSKVARLDPVTAEFTVINPDAGYAIVGAGVSSCAPVKSE